MIRLLDRSTPPATSKALNSGRLAYPGLWRGLVALLAPQVNPHQRIDRGPRGCAVTVSGTLTNEIHQGLCCWGFAGASNFLTVATPAITGDVSVVLIVKPADTTTDQYIMDFGGNNEFAIIKGYQDGYYNAYGGSYPISNNATNSRLPISGGWDVLAYSKDGSTLRGFVNGQQLVSGTITHGDFVPEANVEIGRAYGSTPYFVGKIALCAIYSRAVKCDEMKLLTADKLAFFRQVRYLPLPEVEAGGGGGNRRRRLLIAGTR